MIRTPFLHSLFEILNAITQGLGEGVLRHSDPIYLFINLISIYWKPIMLQSLC